MWILTGPTPEGSQVTLNGIANGYPAAGPLPESVLPYAVALETGGTTKVDVPGSSVASIVVY